MPNPTADMEPEPATMSVPETVIETTMESEPNEDSCPGEFEGIEWSLVHTPAAEGELQLVSIIYDDDLEENYPYSLPSLLAHPAPKLPGSLLVPSNFKSPASPMVPPSLPLHPPLPKTASPSTAGFLQFLGSPSVDYTLLRGSASGPLVSSSTWIAWLPLQSPNLSLHLSSSLPRLHLGPSLWLHRAPPSSTWGRPYGSTELHLLSGSTLVHSPTGSASVNPRSCVSASASRSIDVAWSHHLFGSPGSPSPLAPPL